MCDVDKLESSEVWRFTGLRVMCDDDRFGNLEVYTLCAMMISLKVRRFGSLHTVCDDDKFGSLEVHKFTHSA